MTARSKKAQFYLIAAIIIIIIIFGIYTARNYVKTKEEKTNVYDLQKEFGLESGKIDDFTLYNNQNSQKFLELWIKTYVKNKGQNLDNFIVIYGNETDLEMISYSRNSSGSVNLGGSSWNQDSLVLEISKIDYGENFQINLGNITYPFKLEPGKNFVFIIKEGKFVAA